MRLNQLELIRYGHFSDRVLEFAPHGLTLVYGPNEAGKSTSLAAVADLLYGFPRSTDFAFLFDNKELRLGSTIENRAGQKLAFRRRKGNVNTLLASDETALPDSALAPFIGTTNRAFFEQAFGLSHQRLREGGEAIARSEGDLGRILFEAGSGLKDVAEIQEALAAEADGIYGPRRRADRELYKSLDDYKAAQDSLRAATLKRSEWLEAKAAMETASEHLENARQQARALRNRAARLHRIQRVQPILAELEVLRAQLAELGTKSRLPADASKRYQEAQSTTQHLERTMVECKAQLDAVLSERDELQVDTQLLAENAAFL